MKRILFVDDDPNVLEGLRGLLRKQRKEWEMSFANGGEQALREIAASRYDVLVTDMRMPGVDGAALLQKVVQDCPHLVRIVLSGQTEQEVARRLVFIAHQFLSKPAEGRELQGIIERVCRQQTLLGQPSLLSLVGKIGHLPVRPERYRAVVQMLGQPQVTLAEAGAAIESDAALSAKLLQIANSAFFGLRQRVTDVRAAVSSIGLELLRGLVCSAEVQQSLAPARFWSGYSLESLERLNLLAARIARRLLKDRTAGQDAFCAARLKDVGALVLMSSLPGEFQQVLDRTRASGRPIGEVEIEVLGVSHAQIGAYLSGIWGLPESVSDAIAHHQQPRQAQPALLDPVCAVHIATALAEEVQPADPAEHLGSGVSLDTGLIEQLDLAAQLPLWRQIAVEEAQRS